MSKPNPKIYILALEKLNLNPNQTFFIDDVPEYVDAASKLGISAILFLNPQQLRLELELLGVL